MNTENSAKNGTEGMTSIDFSPSNTSLEMTTDQENIPMLTCRAPGSGDTLFIVVSGAKGSSHTLYDKGDGTSAGHLFATFDKANPKLANLQITMVVAKRKILVEGYFPNCRVSFCAADDYPNFKPCPSQPKDDGYFAEFIDGEDKDIGTVEILSIDKAYPLALHSIGWL